MDVVLAGDEVGLGEDALVQRHGRLVQVDVDDIRPSGKNFTATGLVREGASQTRLTFNTSESAVKDMFRRHGGVHALLLVHAGTLELAPTDAYPVAIRPMRFE